MVGEGITAGTQTGYAFNYVYKLQNRFAATSVLHLVNCCS